MQNEFIDLIQILTLVRIHFRKIALVVLLTTGIATALSFYLPQTYKSTAILSIYSKYFQNPLVRDFISETNDSSELRSHREALIKEALDSNFISKVGDELKIFTHRPGDPKRRFEEEGLRKRMDITNINSITFQVSFTGSKAETAFQLTQTALQAIKHFLVSEHEKGLKSLKTSIGQRLETLGSNSNEKWNYSAPPHPETLKNEILSLENDLVHLKSQFSDQHPVVQQYSRKLKVLQEQSKKNNSLNSSATNLAFNPSQGMDRISNQSKQDLYFDLLKKYNYLDIAIKAESEDTVDYFGVIEQPTFPLYALRPVKMQFAVLGFVFGLVISIIGLLIHPKYKSGKALSIKDSFYDETPLNPASANYQRGTDANH